MNAIVITSIFAPTKAVRAFAQWKHHQCIVVGDRKTPADWELPGVRFIPMEEQLGSGSLLAQRLPKDHYCRKMLGYLHVIAEGAQTILDTDDDNIPKPDRSFPALSGEFNTLNDGLGHVNVYKLFTEQHIWPRGLPLEYILRDQQLQKQLRSRSIEVGIWQGLADEDPDVDAIYRLTSDAPCYFADKGPYVLGKGTISPFNSQNTLYRRELFPLLYLPAHVTFRFTDILRGFVAQPIMWKHGFHLGFSGASVVQERNPHDHMQDLRSEIPMYEAGGRVIDIVGESLGSGGTIADDLFNAYEALLKARIVPAAEMPVLEAWTKELPGS